MSTDEYDLTISQAYRTPGRRLNNFTATVDPTATDDADSLYEVGSVWINVTDDTAWTCVDSSVGNAVWIQGGGSDTQSLFVDLTNSGAVNVDHDNGWTQDLTLTGNTVLTPIATTVTIGDAIDMRLLIRQDGTGGRTLGWGGTITWDTFDGNPPTMPTGANDMMTVGLLSVDDGATWIGYSVDTSTPVLELDDLTDVVLSAPATDDVLIFDGLRWVNSPSTSGAPSDDTWVWMPLTSVDGGEPVLVWDGDDSLIPTLVPLE